MRPAEREEAARIVIDLAGESDAGGILDESFESLVVRILRRDPEFSEAGDAQRLMMAQNLLGLFERLDWEEASAAAEIYIGALEIGSLTDRWAPTQLSLVRPEYRPAVKEILIAQEKDREAASGAGALKTVGTLLPLLVVEQGKNVARLLRYERERRLLEKGVWDHDDDIASNARQALGTIFGLERRGAEGGQADAGLNGAGTILSSLSGKRAGEIGLAPAIVEMCDFLQGLRNEGIPDALVPDALSALALVFDMEMQPTARGLMIISEMCNAIDHPAPEIIRTIKLMLSKDGLFHGVKGK